MCLGLWIPIRVRCTTLCDNVCQWLATGRWFSTGPPDSSTNKADHHDITEVALNKQTWNQWYYRYSYICCNLDLHLEFDSEEQIKTKLYNKRDDFNFPIVNFPFICSNSPAAPVYGVKLYLSVDMVFQSLWFLSGVFDGVLLLTMKLRNQGFPVVKLSHHFKRFTVAIMNWFTVTEYLSQMTTNMLHL